jgi:hypothetical protein
MKQQACRIALGDQAVVPMRPSAAQDQLRRVLHDNDMPTGHPLPGQAPGMLRHLRRRYRPIVKKPAKLHLARPVPAKSTDTRARLCHQRRVQPGPPFSKRRSPNRPSPEIATIYASIGFLADRESRFAPNRN